MKIDPCIMFFFKYQAVTFKIEDETMVFFPISFPLLILKFGIRYLSVTFISFSQYFQLKLVFRKRKKASIPPSGTGLFRTFILQFYKYCMVNDFSTFRLKEFIRNNTFLLIKTDFRFLFNENFNPTPRKFTFCFLLLVKISNEKD